MKASTAYWVIVAILFAILLWAGWGVGDAAALDSGGGFAVHDLDSVDWLQYGMLYYVDECNAAIEHWQA